jgi:hypothetical protein
MASKDKRRDIIEEHLYTEEQVKEIYCMGLHDGFKLGTGNQYDWGDAAEDSMFAHRAGDIAELCGRPTLGEILN